MNTLTIGYFILCIIFLIPPFLYFAFCQKKIAQKLQVGATWQVWLPFLNIFHLLKMAKKPAWWFWVGLVTIIAIVYALLISGNEPVENFGWPIFLLIFLIKFWLGVFLIYGWYFIWKGIVSELGVEESKAFWISMPLNSIVISFIFAFNLAYAIIILFFLFPLFFIAGVIHSSKIAFSRKSVQQQEVPLNEEDQKSLDVMNSEGKEEMKREKEVKKFNLLFLFASPVVFLAILFISVLLWFFSVVFFGAMFK